MLPSDWGQGVQPAFPSLLCSQTCFQFPHTHSMQMPHTPLIAGGLCCGPCSILHLEHLGYNLCRVHRRYGVSRPSKPPLTCPLCFPKQNGITLASVFPHTFSESIRALITPYCGMTQANLLRDISTRPRLCSSVNFLQSL